MVTICSVSFNVQQDRQCTHNVTLRRIRTTITAVKNEVLLDIFSCFCSLRYAGCNAHAHAPVRLNKVFPRYLINGTIFKKKVIEHKTRGLIWCTTLFETFIILKRTERDMVINVYWCSCKVPIILVIF
jgi:hypothetical protein